MPDKSRKVRQVDPHDISEIRSEIVAPSANDLRDVYLVLGDQNSHFEVRAESEFSLAAACAPKADE
jgi:hypothetical protein